MKYGYFWSSVAVSKDASISYAMYIFCQNRRTESYGSGSLTFNLSNSRDRNPNLDFFIYYVIYVVLNNFSDFYEWSPSFSSIDIRLSHKRIEQEVDWNQDDILTSKLISYKSIIGHNFEWEHLEFYCTMTYWYMVLDSTAQYNRSDQIIFWIKIIWDCDFTLFIKFCW